MGMGLGREEGYTVAKGGFDCATQAMKDSKAQKKANTTEISTQQIPKLLWHLIPPRQTPTTIHRHQRPRHRCQHCRQSSQQSPTLPPQPQTTLQHLENSGTHCQTVPASPQPRTTIDNTRFHLKNNRKHSFSTTITQNPQNHSFSTKTPQNSNIYPQIDYISTQLPVMMKKLHRWTPNFPQSTNPPILRLPCHLRLCSSVM